MRVSKLSLVLAALLLASATSSTLAQQKNHGRDLGLGHSQLQQHGHIARRTPVKRDYDTHAYYVLELRDGSSWSEAEQLASSLGAEMVEQVGELQHHWLIRAPFNDHLLKRSERSISSEPSADHVMDTFYELVGQALLGFDQRQTHPVVGHRDLISNVQDASSLHDKRAFSHPRIVGLERQVLKKRVKRELDPTYANNVLSRQEETRPKKQAQVSQYLRDIASRLGIADPLWAKQWHLANDQMQENSINVTGVWAQGVTGKGIKVAIVDDGLDSRWSWAEIHLERLQADMVVWH
jgi:kexin